MQKSLYISLNTSGGVREIQTELKVKTDNIVSLLKN